MEENEKVIIHVVNLLNGEGYKGEVGIYKFGILGAHQIPYIVCITSNNFHILTDYKTISVIKSFKKFIRLNRGYFTEIQQAELLSTIARFLYHREKMIESFSISEKIDY